MPTSSSQGPICPQCNGTIGRHYADCEGVQARIELSNRQNYEAGLAVGRRQAAEAALAAVNADMRGGGVNEVKAILVASIQNAIRALEVQ